MRKPIIGVTPLWDAERNSVWMLPEYLEGLHAAGGIPVVLPLLAEPEEQVQPEPDDKDRG